MNERINELSRDETRKRLLDWATGAKENLYWEPSFAEGIKALFAEPANSAPSNERIERARRFVAKKTTYGNTSDLIVRLCAEFAESELARENKYTHNPETCGCGSDWEYCPYLQNPPIPHLPTNPDAPRAIAERVAEGLFISTEGEAAFLRNDFPVWASDRITEILSAALPTWIPINVLPDKSGHYLVSYYDETEGVRDTDIVYFQDKWFSTPGMDLEAWMDRPEPYNPEQARDVFKRTAALPVWVAVGERLPTEAKHYLVQFAESPEPEIYWFGEGRWWTDYDGFAASRDVVAWMPLPAPYVEASE